MRRTMRFGACVVAYGYIRVAGPVLAAKSTKIVQEGEGTTKSTSEEGCQISAN